MSEPTGERPDAVSAEFRSGFACLVGRPNAGKSTLTNTLVGRTVAITSSKPQTTRHAVRGIVHRADGQLVVVDTPGLHRPRTTLGSRLNDIVRATWSEVDVIGICVPANERIGPGDRFLAGEVAKLPRKRPVVAVVTKTDTVPPPRVAEQLAAVAELGEQLGLEWASVVPTSARDGGGVDTLAAEMVALLPEGPPLYPDGQLTDEPESVLAAEIIREAALERVRDELPHSIAVLVEEMGLREDRPDDRPLLDVYAKLFVERDSQRPIVIGKGGSGLREIGKAARHRLEALLGTPVFLDLRVSVAKNWQTDTKQLRRLGF